MVSDLIFADNCLRAIRILKAVIHYNQRSEASVHHQYLTFADARLGKTVYGETG